MGCWHQRTWWVRNIRRHGVFTVCTFRDITPLNRGLVQLVATDLRMLAMLAGSYSMLLGLLHVLLEKERKNIFMFILYQGNPHKHYGGCSLYTSLSIEPFLHHWVLMGSQPRSFRAIEGLCSWSLLRLIERGIHEGIPLYYLNIPTNGFTYQPCMLLHIAGPENTPTIQGVDESFKQDE